ncbi:PACE efflux transporter [uncultured Amaricoccus sp.]|nr:PACE efflux transporter [uncultured Amaricoccus sp.]HRO11166.1 PACE efflux transporter [Amaricoccus sp.]
MEAVQGVLRRIVYVSLYEGIAILATSAGVAGIYGVSGARAGVLAVGSSTVAMLWNFVFNTFFERWEARHPAAGRSFARRVAHAAGFEGGLALILVPLAAWWLGITLVEALILDLGLLVFFLAYTFGFTWGFDRLFGLPGAYGKG